MGAPSRFHNGAEHGYVDDYHFRSALVRVPQLMHPRGLPDGRPPCPRCKTRRHVAAKGLLQKLTRRDVLLRRLGLLLRMPELRTEQREAYGEFPKLTSLT